MGMHQYLRFATSFLTLGGNLLRVNRFFLFAFVIHKHKWIWECSNNLLLLFPFVGEIDTAIIHNSMALGEHSDALL
jgi:hypothetical protein